MNKTEQGCWQHCTKRQQRLDDSDLLAQFHIPSQGRPERLHEEQGEKGTRHAFAVRSALSFRIFRPRLFSKRMALLRPATEPLIWLR